MGNCLDLLRTFREKIMSRFRKIGVLFFSIIFIPGTKRLRIADLQKGSA